MKKAVPLLISAIPGLAGWILVARGGLMYCISVLLLECVIMVLLRRFSGKTNSTFMLLFSSLGIIAGCFSFALFEVGIAALVMVLIVHAGLQTMAAIVIEKISARGIRIILHVLLVVVLSVALCVGILHTAWFQRNYAYYGDRISISAYVDGVLLEPGAYEIAFDGEGDVLRETPLGYSLPGDYGTYWFTLHWQGRETSFFLENVNDWWRTNINLYIDTHKGTVQQTNTVWNNDPAFADSFTLEWE